LDTAMTTKPLIGHLGRVCTVTFLPDGRTLVSGAEDDTVRLWDVVTGKEFRCFGGHTGGVRALAVSRDGSLILSASDDHSIRKWDLSRPARFRELALGLSPVQVALDANPDDAGALKTLGEWYAFRARDDWAAECL